MNFWSALLDISRELAPWLLLGTAVTGVMHAFLPKGFIRRALTGRRGVTAAVLVGVPLPLCSCGVIPAGLGLKEDGASDGATVGFMISTPQTGVDSIFVSAAFLGWPFAIFKLVSAAVMGLSGGWLADRWSETRNPLTVSDDVSVDQTRPGITDGFFHAINVLRTIWGWLVIGLLVSAALTVWLPATGLNALNEWGSLGAGIAALVISLPLYVCATASVPIAAALVAAGLPAGAALVFLMAGPASNVATIGAIYRALGRRILFVYLVVLVVGSLACGLVFDQLVNSVNTSGHMAMEHHSLLHDLAVGLLAMTLFWFAWEDIRGRLGPATVPDDVHLRVAVSGMTCNGCRGKLERGLNADPEVTQAIVILEPGEARITGRMSEARLREVIDDLGFEPGTLIQDKR